MNGNTVGERNPTTGVVTDYVFGPGIDEPLAKRTANGSITYYGVDGLGSVVVATDPTGAVLNSTAYSPWGEMIFPTPDLFGYTGRESGGPSWYYRARYYDAPHGRFLSEDPLGSPSSTGMIAMSGTVAPYGYVENDPVARRDPFGLKSCGPLPPCAGVPCGACCAQRFQWGLCALEVSFHYAHVYEVGATAAGVAAGAYFGGWQGAAAGGLIGLAASYWYLHELQIAAEAAVRREFEHCVDGCKNPEACRWPRRPSLPVPPGPPVFGN